MKNLKFLGMLFCLCLLSCGGKAQKNHVVADSVKQEQTVSLPLGASGFPECIKKAWRVSLQDSMMYVALENTAEDNCELFVRDNSHAYFLSYYDNGKWKDVTGQMVSPKQRYEKKETQLKGSDLSKLICLILLPGKTSRFSIPLYNGTTRSIEKGRYRLTFYIDGKPCYIVFEL